VLDDIYIRKWYTYDIALGLPIKCQVLAERVSQVSAISSSHSVNTKIDERLPTPLYHQIYVILRNKIIEHEFVFDDYLPSEEETAQAFGVSRITSKRALNELADEGLVVRERGRGTRVIHKGPISPQVANIEGMLENIMAMGLETEASLLEFDYVRPTDRVVEALKCSPDCRVQRAVRLRSHEGQAFSHLLTFVPEPIASSYTQDDLASTPLLVLLERGGIVVSRAVQTLTATLADANVAPLLNLDIGAPLLRIRRIVYDQNNQPIEFITGLYRPDRYQYRMNLSRVSTDQSNAWAPTS
jgi:GntR family transcriptional regulator